MNLIWEVGHTTTLNDIPDKWYTALVPGAVQLDMAKALNYGRYYFAENWKDYGWMESELIILPAVSPVLVLKCNASK